MARTNRPTTLDPDAWKKKDQEIQEKTAKRDAERRAQREAEESRNKTLDNIWARTGVKRQEFIDEASDYVGKGGTYTEPLSEGVEYWLNRYKEKSKSALGGASAHRLLLNLFKENPSQSLAMYGWLDKNAPSWSHDPAFKAVHDERRRIMMEASRGRLDPEEALGYVSLDAQAVTDPLLAKEMEIAKDTQNKTRDLYLEQQKKDDAEMESFKKKGITDEYHKTRRKDLLDKALKYGFSGTDYDKKLTAAYDKAFEKHGDVAKAYDEVENSLNKNANKKYMAQRGAQMNADLKARQDAIRDNPIAAKRRAALKAQWGNPTMSQAQIEAAARWKHERQSLSGTSGNKAAFQEQKAYRASPQYGQDVYGMAQQNGRSLTPGSVGYTYEQNFNHNQRMMEAEERAAQGNAATVQGLASAVDKVPVNGNPTPAQTKAIAQTPVTTGADPNKNFGS